MPADDESLPSGRNDDVPAEARDNVIYPDPEIERDVYEEPIPFPLAMAMAGGQGTRGTAPGTEEDELMQMLNSLRNQSNFDSNSAAGFSTFASFGNIGGAPNDSNFANDPLLASLFGPQSAGSTQSSHPPPPESRLRKLLNSKVHIAIMSILTYALINTAPFSCNVFLLFLLWEIIEIFILRQHHTKSNGIVNIAIMMAGVSPTKVNVFIKWFQLVNKVLRDIAIFLFFFVLSHIAYLKVIGGSLVGEVEEVEVVREVVYGDIPWEEHDPFLKN